MLSHWSYDQGPPGPHLDLTFDARRPCLQDRLYRQSIADVILRQAGRDWSGRFGIPNRLATGSPTAGNRRSDGVKDHDYETSALLLLTQQRVFGMSVVGTGGRNGTVAALSDLVFGRSESLLWP